MIFVMKPTATPEQVGAVTAQALHCGLRAYAVSSLGRTLIAVVGDSLPAERPAPCRPEWFNGLGGIERMQQDHHPFVLASRQFIPENTLFKVGAVEVGGGGVMLIAGPCSVESREQLLETAHAVRDAGAHALRGGAFKPRSSPYSFQGLGEKGLELLAEARQQTGLPVVTEVMAPEDVPLVAQYADVLQVGSRNMQNSPLLLAVGESQRPVLLKRGMSATVEEMLLAAEYVLSRGNMQVILCERGIRTFETQTRFTTDINAIPVMKSLTHLPVFLDPSHSTGNWQYVSAIGLAGIAAGADGLIVEVHPHPERALSDGQQSLRPDRFADLTAKIRAVAQAINR